MDSVAALTPRAELEGQMGDQSVGLQARMMSQAMRKLAGNLNRTKTLCVFTNQIREKVGVMFGSPETQPGGRALKFYASQRLDIRRIETLKDGTEAVGNRVRVKVVKNKVAAPFRQAEFDIEFGKGISSSGCILDLGIEHSIVTKSGSFFSYGDERLGQGRNNAKAYLDTHPEVAKEIESKVYEVLGVSQDLVEPIEGDPAGRRRPGGRRLGVPGPHDVPTPGGGDARTRPQPTLSRPASSPPPGPSARATTSSARRRSTSPGASSPSATARRPRSGGTSSPSAWTRGSSRRCVAALLEGGYVDDAAFAGRFAEDRRNLDQWGADRIERRLQELGVDRDLIAAALGDGRARRARSRVRAARAPLPGSRPRRRATSSGRSASCSARATTSSWRTTRCAATRGGGWRTDRRSVDQCRCVTITVRYYDPPQRQIGSIRTP